MSESELQALLWLRCLPGLGDRRLRDLLRRHGSAAAVRAIPLQELSPQVGKRQLQPIATRAQRARWLLGEQAVQLLVVDRPGYPPELAELGDAPVLLFARGDLALLGQRSVAVVGTRRPTEYGISVTQQLVAGLARAGVVIWSGLARGIDGVAHRTALENGGPTVAVLGSGIDVPYPREHAGLLEDIARAGLVLSEFMPGEPPLAHHFPQRNRIIARLAQGVLVVEARPDGGALITADAGSSARPIMAVPGPVGRLTSMGPNRLIQEGAKLVIDVADVLEEIGGQLNAAAARGRPSARHQWRKLQAGAPRADAAQLSLGAQGEPAAAAARHAQAPASSRTIPIPGDLVSAFEGRGPLHADEVAARCGLSSARTLARLLELELAGVVEQLSGKRFRLTERPNPNRRRLALPDLPAGN